MNRIYSRGLKSGQCAGHFTNTSLSKFIFMYSNIFHKVLKKISIRSTASIICNIRKGALPIGPSPLAKGRNKIFSPTLY